MLEKEVERKMGAMVRARGGQFLKWVSPGMPGVPDRVLILPCGKVWFVELKTDKGRLSAIQKHTHKMLSGMGCNVHTVYGHEDARKFVEEVFENAI